MSSFNMILRWRHYKSPGRYRPCPAMFSIIPPPIFLNLNGEGIGEGAGGGAAGSKGEIREHISSNVIPRIGRRAYQPDKAGDR